MEFQENNEIVEEIDAKCKILEETDDYLIIN
jgi:hypothetical protein